MVKNVGDIRGGMDVYALDGERLGTVIDVLLSPSDADTPDIQEPLTVSLPPDAPGPLDADVAHIAPTDASTSYFTVEGDNGLYSVPFSAVATFFPGQNVTLDCTREECATRYRRPPR